MEDEASVARVGVDNNENRADGVDETWQTAEVDEEERASIPLNEVNGS